MKSCMTTQDSGFKSLLKARGILKGDLTEGLSASDAGQGRCIKW